MAEALMVNTGTAAGAATGISLASRSIVHLPSSKTADDAPWSLELGELSDRDERLRRRERLLHHLDMERQRRRRRSA